MSLCVYTRDGGKRRREKEREREREREREVEKEDRGKMKECEGDERGRLCGAAVSCGDVTTQHTQRQQHAQRNTV